MTTHQHTKIDFTKMRLNKTTEVLTLETLESIAALLTKIERHLAPRAGQADPRPPSQQGQKNPKR